MLNRINTIPSGVGQKQSASGAEGLVFESPRARHKSFLSSPPVSTPWMKTFCSEGVFLPIPPDKHRTDSESYAAFGGRL